MSAQQVELAGTITVGGGVCTDACSGGSLKQQSLTLRCSNQWYPAVVSSDVPVQIQTPGAVGSAWIDVPVVYALDRIELLMVRSNAPVRIRSGAAVARLVGVGAAFPIVFVGGEIASFTIDGGALVSCVFTAGAKTAQQTANALNAAAALAGLVALPWSVDTSGQLAISGVATGVQGSVSVGGAAQATIGFGVTSTAVGAGADIDIVGLYLVEYGRGSMLAPQRVQISGTAQIEVFAAGTTA